MKTVSLELAKQLKEAGYPQEGNSFYWFNQFRVGESWIFPYTRKEIDLQYMDEGRAIASPTADEILDSLPKEIKIAKTEYLFGLGIGLDKRYFLDYRDVNDGQLNWSEEDSLADAAAKMWLYLKKENLL